MGGDSVDGYRIGKVAEFLGLSSEALRNYEREGIIHARRDQESGYRYYNAWDINYLLDCTYYRSFGFPVSTCKSIICDADLDQLTELYEAHTETLQQQIHLLQKKLECTCDFLAQLREIRSKLGSFTPVKSPALLFYPIREKDNLRFERDAMAAYADWNQCKPFCKNTCLIPGHKNGGDFDRYFWGYSLPADSALAANMEGQAEQILPYPAIYTVFCAHGENTFIQSFREQVIVPLEKQGYQISQEQVVGNLLARVHENGEICRYCEVWVPLTRPKTQKL